jgi:hypothetical protein
MVLGRGFQHRFTGKSSKGRIWFDTGETSEKNPCRTISLETREEERTWDQKRLGNFPNRF